MDSGNSGSFQSSSGGDEEYDSRPESISALLISNNPKTHIASMANQQPPNHHQSSNTTMFDPLSNFFDPLSTSRSNLNFDMVWSKNLRSDPNSSYIGGLVMPSLSSTQSQSQLFLGNNQLGQTTNRAAAGSTTTTFQGIQIPQENETQRGNSNSVSNDQNTQINNNSNTNVVVRNNPKKRSRASRRAPTTVLTTDTNNFRAMVQEFTGIPAPPFTSSSPFPSRTRFDLFGSSSSSSVSLSHSPYNLLRPSIQPQPSSTNVVSNIPTTSINYHQLSSSSSDQLANFLKPPLPHHHQQQFNMNMQNPILNFQSLLQAQQKYPSSNSSINSLDVSRNDPHLKMGILEGQDQFGLSHAQVNHWGGGVGSNDNTSSQNDNVDQGLVMRSINGGNYTTNSERQVVNGDDKGQEINVTPRSEGIMESWICSSD